LKTNRQYNGENKKGEKAYKTLYRNKTKDIAT
jgi:hypothetical protein